MRQTKGSDRSPGRRNAAERAYALAFAALQDEDLASEAVVQALHSADRGETGIPIVERTLQLVRSILDKNPHSASEVDIPVPEQMTDSGPPDIADPPALSPEQWGSLWRALLGRSADSEQLAGAIRIIEHEPGGPPVRDEDIP